MPCVWKATASANGSVELSEVTITFRAVTRIDACGGTVTSPSTVLTMATTTSALSGSSVMSMDPFMADMPCGTLTLLKLMSSLGDEYALVNVIVMGKWCVLVKL